MEVLVVASSSVDGGIGCWNLHTGAEQLRYKSCASPAHGLTAVGDRFLAASQLRNASASSGSIFYWSWTKPQVEVKSFPAESIKPLTANSHGTYIVGGGSNGDIYLWEVSTGKLLKKWYGHYHCITCLVFSEDDSLLVSGAQDGSVRVWSLLRLFDDFQRQQGGALYEYNFHKHAMPVTDVVMSYGGCNAIIVSAAEDRSCKVWSLSNGKLLRDIPFPVNIYALALDPGGTVLYAGGKDGKIYVCALNAKSDPSKNYEKHILGSVAEQSKAVTCLAYSAEGNLLLSGSEDGEIRVWDPKTHIIVRLFRHAKGPVSNMQIVRRPINTCNSTMHTLKRHGPLLPPPLEKYERSTKDFMDDQVMVGLPANDVLIDTSYLSPLTINDQIKELQQQGSAAADETKADRLKLECERSLQMVQQWKKMYENLHQFCVTELLEKGQTGGSN